MLSFPLLLRWLPGTLALALTALTVPAAASAQDLPSYAQPVVVSTDETIHGRIASVDGAFNVRVNDDRGFVDNVVLHQGTIINPTGLTLSSGMSVTIAGYNAGSVFDANEIDTPYSYSGELPVPVYYGPGYWCPGFGYGYGPSFSLAFIIGGGFDRFEHRPFYGRPWNGRAYFGDYVGRPSGSRVFIGERRSSEGESHGQRRGFGDIRTGRADVPHAFSGQSFAGRSYTGGSPAAGSRGELRFPSGTAHSERRFPPASMQAGRFGPAVQRAAGGASRPVAAPHGEFARGGPSRVQSTRPPMSAGTVTRGSSGMRGSNGMRR